VGRGPKSRRDDQRSKFKTLGYKLTRCNQGEVLMAHLYSTRKAVMGDPSCGGAFGGDVVICRKAFPYIASVFNSPDAVRNWNLDGFCNDSHVNVLVASDIDPVWQDIDSWVWTGPASSATCRCARSLAALRRIPGRPIVRKQPYTIIAFRTKLTVLSD
jgi:hypothetical protein